MQINHFNDFFKFCPKIVPFKMVHFAKLAIQQNNLFMTTIISVLSDYFEIILWQYSTLIINEGTLRYFFAVAFTYDSSEIIDSFKWNDSVPVSHKWNHNLISIYKILQNILALFKHPNKGPYKYPIYRSTSWQSHFKGPFKCDFHRWKITNAWVQKHKTKFA